MQIWNQTVRICLALWVATWVLFWPTGGFEFLNYDDDEYVTEQLVIHEGVTWKGIRWAFTNIHAANWHPLTSLSHMLDCELFGLNPRGPHLINVFFHSTNSVLLFLLLLRMTRAKWPSAFAAAVFAWHPLHVESVAWVSERKDVLSAFFWLLTTMAYCRYVESKTSNHRRASRYYIATVVLFALGLMSKPMLVTLPFTLLLLDFWPLKRLTSSARPERLLEPGLLRKAVFEKLPLFALTLACCVITFIVQNKAGAVQELDRFPLSVRAGNAVVSYARYLGNLFWPTDLAALYEHQGAWPMSTIFAATALIALISVIAVRLLRHAPYVSVGWFWFLGTLVPVIGLVQVGVQSIADRYMYVPMIGVLIVLGLGCSQLANRLRLPAALLGMCALVAVIACLIKTRNQLQFWRNSEILWIQATKVSPNSPTAQLMLANVREREGRIDLAIKQCETALQINPNLPQARYNLGNYAWGNGRNEQAIEHYTATLKMDSNFWAAHNNLGILYHQQGRSAEAFHHASEAARLNPTHPPALCNLALHFLNRNEVRQAVEILLKGLKIDSEYFELYKLLGNAYAMQDKLPEAIEHYQTALRLQNDLPDAHFNLGNCLKTVGRWAEARNHYQETLRLRPNHEKARMQLQALDVQ
jgi:tetratricopeptide (TPR) repeat protein